MDLREEDQQNQVDLDQLDDISNQNGAFVQKINEFQDIAAEKYDDINQIMNYRMRVVQEKLGFTGEKSQVYQQAALFVAVMQLIIATFLSMLISQTTFLGYAWTFIPWLQYVFIIAYLSTIIAIQYFTEKIYQQRYNFGVFCIYTISKIILVVFISIWFFDIRLEIFLVALVAIQGYLALKINVPTQKNEEFDLKVKDLWKKMTIYQLCVSIFLVSIALIQDVFQQSSYLVGPLAFILTLLLGFYTILCLQRFKEYSFHQKNKTQTPTQQSSIRSEKEAENMKQVSEQGIAVQSIKSFAD
ncbi:unnamed protein product [Paramecium sonneborni]|uniref:Transmembrane protein n=1 Tax=Paramecium sonneborni TaxID=65129 RepID=A0A8S1KBP2_9CILI|nr:unnamed protein product [Paramecium sonneborni]